MHLLNKGALIPSVEEGGLFRETVLFLENKSLEGFIVYYFTPTAQHGALY